MLNTNLFNVRDFVVVGVMSLVAAALFSQLFAAIEAKTGE